MEPNEHYALKGVKNVDGVIHIPLLEIVTLCRIYPKVTGEQLQALIATAYKNLQQNEELKKAIPSIETTKKSFIKKLFEKRSAPDASQQKA